MHFKNDIVGLLHCATLLLAIILDGLLYAQGSSNIFHSTAKQLVCISSSSVS